MQFCALDRHQLSLLHIGLRHLLFDFSLSLSASDRFHLNCSFGMSLPLQSDDVTAQSSSVTLHMGA